MTTPTLINLPSPPADPVTPSDMGPGTPNSGTTSLSALSTTAIKDGHQGHTLPHGHHHHHQSSRDSSSSSTTLDAERADRISRLAGLERVATVRPSRPSQLSAGSAANPPPGYFDNATPQVKERSTVGSASATGSIGGRTTWASGSIDNDADKMSEDQDDGLSSTGGFSDENASLVGFGEGAGSTVSVPISTATSRAAAARYNPASSSSTNKATSSSSHVHQAVTSVSGGGPINPTSTGGGTDPKMVDGMSYDANTVDTTMQPAAPVHQPQPSSGFSGQGADIAANGKGDRVPGSEASRLPMSTPDQGGDRFGNFPVERK